MVLSIAGNNPFLRTGPTKCELIGEPPKNKRFLTAVLLHEGVHEAIFRHFIPSKSQPEEDFLLELKRMVGIKTAMKKMEDQVQTSVDSILEKLKKDGFKETEIDEFLTPYYKKDPSEFFTTLIEAYIQPRLESASPESLATKLDNFSVTEVQKIQMKLAKYSERENDLLLKMLDYAINEMPPFMDFL